MSRQCVFCGSESDLTREHVLPDWLTEIGLDLESSLHHVGPLNRLPRQWTAKPFRTTVKMVCADGGNLMRLPLYCGKHEAFYPAALAGETLRTGKQHVFLTGCECPMGYIVRTEADGAHMKKWGEPAAIEAAYEEWPGEEFVIEDDDGVFFFKEEHPQAGPPK